MWNEKDIYKYSQKLFFKSFFYEFFYFWFFWVILKVRKRIQHLKMCTLVKEHECVHWWKSMRKKTVKSWEKSNIKTMCLWSEVSLKIAFGKCLSISIISISVFKILSILYLFFMFPLILQIGSTSTAPVGITYN